MFIKNFFFCQLVRIHLTNKAMKILTIYEIQITNNNFIKTLSF